MCAGRFEKKLHDNYVAWSSEHTGLAPKFGILRNASLLYEIPVSAQKLQDTG